MPILKSIRNHKTVSNNDNWEYFGGGWRRSRPKTSRVVIDTHAHLFPRLGKSKGWDHNIHTKLSQNHMRDFNTFWRKKDNVRVDGLLLDYPSDDIEQMPNLNFRITDHGRAEFVKDGIEYYMQIYPPGLSSMEVSPERMLGEMDIAGVDVCVLQSDHVYGELNEFYGNVSRKYPNKFAPLAQIKEWNADQKDELQHLEKAVCEEGCIGLSFSVEGFALNGYKDQIDDRKFDSLWNLVEELDIPIWWYLDARKRDRASAFMERLEELGRWTETHPDIPNLLTHGLVPATLIHNMGIPDALTNLLKKPHTYAEFQNPAKWPEYPYPEGQDLIKRMCEEVGVESFTWGSDMPFSAGYWCTYKQSVDHIDIHCDFLSEKERNLILGGNAARILNIDITE